MARSEMDRRRQVGFFESMIRRPEIGAFFVMIIILVGLAFASIPDGGSLADSTAYNPLGIVNNTRIIAQLGIIAIGAFALMVAGEFDLSIGSMIGFAGMCMAVMLKWGFFIPNPFGDGHLVAMQTVSPSAAFLITCVFTLAFGWLIGFITVRSGLPSFIVSLAFLFFLRGLTEVCFRYLNKGPNDKSGSTQVSDLPDFKNLIDLERYREMLTWPITEAGKAAQGCLSIFSRPLNNSFAKTENVQVFIDKLSPSRALSPEQLASIQEQAAAATSKEEIAAIVDKVCAVDPNSISLIMERTFAAKRLPAEDLVTIFNQIPTGQQERLRDMLTNDNALIAQRLTEARDLATPLVPKSVGEVDIARAYFDTLSTINPVADLFGGRILEWLFSWLNTIGWNITERTGAQWVDGLYAVVGWWVFLIIVTWYVMSQTRVGNWIYATGGNLNAAKANGVPTDAVKISLFMFTAFTATIFAATQVFDTNSADAAKGNLKELEAIATAVVGGAILTGGFGTVWGVVFGAVIFGLAQNALFYIPWLDGAFYRMFLGSILLAAALLNENVRKRFTGGI